MLSSLTSELLKCFMLSLISLIILVFFKNNNTKNYPESNRKFLTCLLNHITKLLKQRNEYQKAFHNVSIPELFLAILSKLPQNII